MDAPLDLANGAHRPKPPLLGCESLIDRVRNFLAPGMKAAETQRAKLVDLIVQAGTAFNTLIHKRSVVTVLREDWKPRPLAATKAMGPARACPFETCRPPAVMNKLEVSIQLGGMRTFWSIA